MTSDAIYPAYRRAGRDIVDDDIRLETDRRLAYGQHLSRPDVIEHVSDVVHVTPTFPSVLIYLTL